jgi:phosphate/sulfate permease
MRLVALFFGILAIAGAVMLGIPGEKTVAVWMLVGGIIGFGVARMFAWAMR